MLQSDDESAPKQGVQTITSGVSNITHGVTVDKKDNEITFDIVSSTYWLDDIKYANSYEATSHADIVAENEE